MTSAAPNPNPTHFAPEPPVRQPSGLPRGINFRLQQQRCGGHPVFQHVLPPPAPPPPSPTAATWRPRPVLSQAAPVCHGATRQVGSLLPGPGHCTVHGGSPFNLAAFFVPFMNFKLLDVESEAVNAKKTNVL